MLRKKKLLTSCLPHLLTYAKKKNLRVSTQKKNTKMINYDKVIKENVKDHNPNCSQIPDHREY